MGIAFGNVKAGTVLFGGSRIGKAVFGGKTVYKKKDGEWHCPNPFWMEGSTAMVKVNSSTTGFEGLEYSEDCKTWTPNTNFFISKGKRIYFRAKKLNRTASSSNIIPSMSVSDVRVGGDVRSLIEDYKGELVDYAFSRLFYNASNLVDASELILDGKLATYCCNEMFRGCTSLKKAPQLKATELGDDCYEDMFYGCSKLTNAPALPATELAPYCYFEMFRGCSLLTQPSELPATTLVEGCYGNMFYGCKALTQAPELPAATLKMGCYSYMFYGCTNLNEVKVGATVWLGNYTANWLSGVAAEGTFYKRTGVVIQSGAYGIPSGWTVVEYEPQA